MEGTNLLDQEVFEDLLENYNDEDGAVVVR